MKTIAGSRGIAIFFAILLGSCSGGGGGGGGGAIDALPSPEPTLGTLITSPTVSAVTTFAQTVPLAAGEYNAVFPGQANVWQILPDFSILDGGDDQFDGALKLSVAREGIGSEIFPDVTYEDLTFYTPTMSAADGVKTAAVSDGRDRNNGSAWALTGIFSAYLNSTSDSRLLQKLNLSGATGTVTASWNDYVVVCDGTDFGGGPNLNIIIPDPGYRVVVRDVGGAELVELFSVSTPGLLGITARTADLTSFVTTTPNIVLSFEQRGTHCHSSVTVIDDVSVKDSAGSPVEYVTNGDFETGTMTGWATNKPEEIQNITTKPKTVNGLDVTRSFYTVPNKLWGRWVDVFENNTISAITATVNYSTYVGSDSCSIIYSTPDTGGMAITNWDGCTGGRDLGMVFGKADAVQYVSDTGLGNGSGQNYVNFDYGISVEAGKKTAIVNFIIMDGTDTRYLASTTDMTARATSIDAEAKNIVDLFWSDGQYRTGMTQEQINAIQNF